MLNSLKKIKEEVNHLFNQHNEIVDYFFEHVWSDERPSKIGESSSALAIDFDLIQYTPEERKIPIEFKQRYHDWYSSCSALLERNYNRERISEFKLEYDNEVKRIISAAYITQSEGYKFIDSFKHQASILKALPNYLEQRVQDIELTIASTLMDDELLEAEYLLNKGFIRASGALAGVVLERYLKMRCDNNEPKLKYSKNATISKLNDILRDNNLVDIIEWRKIQYLGDIRNKCDHDRKSEPKREEITDLISKVKEMIHYY
ncbi:MAG: hypothetical protein JW878_03460 [Methanomicrobia archaeon]|nr:hypothetical protein [Methanomicrobia archaeon]